VVMYVLCILRSSAGTLTMTAYDCLIRIDYMDECDLPPTIRMPSIFYELFFWWGTYRADILHDI
jgi:hypothetical protein